MNNDEPTRAQIDGSYAINAQLADGTTLNVSGYVIAGMTVDERNHALDTAMLLVERQKKFANLPKLEARLQSEEQHREIVLRQLDAWQARTKTPSNKKDEVDKLQDQVRLHNENIASLRGQILMIKSEMSGVKPQAPKLVA